MNILLKVKYSFYSALVFYLVANPETYKITDWMFSSIMPEIANSAGSPTPAGFFLHTIIFFIVILSLMMFPRD
jgi:hypothetical protein